ncbi:MAG: N-6 DNA methylase [Nitrospiraceae bacterium]|nr:N-6 DNA methylase [Nitrospiraceae bacterium]
MSVQLINQYYNKLDRIIQYGGSRNETAIRSAFYNLLNEYAHKRNLEVVTEIPCRGTKGVNVYPDGIVKNALRLDYGYWESKDEADDLDEEINKKFKKGYPNSNILFEDGSTAVLFQQNDEVGRVDMKDPEELDRILTAFISYEHPEVKSFNEAIEHFKRDIPTIVETLHKMMEAEHKSNKAFQKAMHGFFELCKDAINPGITYADVQEMLIQHILTEEIFVSIFSEAQFHRENNIARELNKVEETFFTGQTKRQTLDTIKNYYEMIKAQATSIVSHHEKQKFLKIIYENFYKAYNPKGADKLGIVYTPNEIVNFIIESTDYLLHKHFNKTLSDKNVDILDPATGTGTFICDLIEYLPKKNLAYKYQNEIHANEVAILPYYIANLNIEYTFRQKMEYYEEFKNICFVDTLDNVGGLEYLHQQTAMFGFSGENAERIKAQNRKKISVILGNPPYNANQMNENDNNKNRVYPEVDMRIRNTYIAESTAQKTKLYDMYTRFLRWASDRVDVNGIIAFVTNNSFLKKRAFDGFRKVIEQEFNEIYIVDLKGDARTSGEQRRREGGNVFDNTIRVGVAVYFLVKSKKEQGCKIYYHAIDDYVKSNEKKDYLCSNKLAELSFAHIQPDKHWNWLDIAFSDFEDLLPLIDKNVKHGKGTNAVFRMFSLGVVTARDEWVYDERKDYLEKKVSHLIDVYNQDLKRLKGKSAEDIRKEVNYSIKWTRAVKNDIARGKKYKFDRSLIVNGLYRPFVKRKLYFARELNEMQYQQRSIFGTGYENSVICVNVGSKAFNVLAADAVPDYHVNGDCNCLAYYWYDEYGNRVENITDWGLKQFKEHYDNKKITKWDIFFYTYAVLHHPEYREKYDLDLKQEFPRLPFYEDFFQWRDSGKKLADLHINFEKAKPFKLKRTDIDFTQKQKELFTSETTTDKHLFGYKTKLKVRLKAIKDSGTIEIDEQTTLSGIPPEAWEYKLGHYSALEWVLDQYKESKISDATIAKDFNTYRFADYKEEVIELLKRVCTVSVETMDIIMDMPCK